MVGCIALCKNNIYHISSIGNVGKHLSRMHSDMEHKLPYFAISKQRAFQLFSCGTGWFPSHAVMSPLSSEMNHEEG